MLPAGLLPVAAALLLLGKFGPTLAGLIMIYMTKGPAGFADIRRRLRSWPSDISSYAIVFLVPLALVGIALAIFHFLGAATPELGTSILFLLPLVFLQKAFIGGGLGEELGWRGFALPVLLPRVGSVKSSVLIGFIWALWHWPALLFNQSTLPEIVVFSLGVVALSFIFTWLHVTSKGSLVLVVIFHAWINVPLTVLDNESPGFTDGWMFSKISVAAVSTIAVCLILFGRRVPAPPLRS
jgi:membrane protease YdiL (CAAX protease family)